jgi:hypothetical protein
MAWRQVIRFGLVLIWIWVGGMLISLVKEKAKTSGCCCCVRAYAGVTEIRKSIFAIARECAGWKLTRKLKLKNEDGVLDFEVKEEGNN